MVMVMLSKFFNPHSIALIGASNKPGKIGFELMKNIIESGFEGKIYPVNPKLSSILNLKCYSSILDIPEPVDLAIIVVPAPLVPKIMKDCGEKAIKNVIIISAGFSEVGNSKLEEEVRQIAKRYNIRVIGPNCAGIISSWNNLFAFFETRLEKGTVSVLSQSGAFGGALMTYISKEGLGISKFVSYGNAMDIDETDLIGYFLSDEKTSVIGLYVEAIRRGRKFANILKSKLKEISKPIVVLKTGRTTQGERAASSHTGALAGRDKIYDGVFRQLGIIRAYDFEEFVDSLYILSLQPGARSNKIYIVTNSGGPGVMATDAAILSGLIVESPPEAIKKKLSRFLPPVCSINNPIDLTADASYERYYNTLVSLLDSSEDEIGGVLVICVPPVFINSTDVAKAIIDANIEYKKRGVPLVACFMSGDVVKDSSELLKKNGIPVFPTPERAARALSKLYHWHIITNRKAKK